MSARKNMGRFYAPNMLRDYILSWLIHPSILFLSITHPHPFICLSVYLSTYVIYLSIYLSNLSLSTFYHLSVYLSSRHFCRFIIAVSRPPIWWMLPGILPRHSPVYGRRKMSVESPTTDFPGSFSPVWGIRKKIYQLEKLSHFSSGERDGGASFPH